MRIIYVTASLPYGTQEAFIIAEINALTALGHDVLVVPRSPRGRPIHAGELQTRSESKRLLSPTVLWRASRIFFASPGRVVTVASCISGSRSLAIAFKNVTVMPKALWLADLAKAWSADHIHCHWAATTATMALLASRLSGVPWSLTAHRWDIVENNLLATKAKSAAFLRVISDGGQRMVTSRGVDDVRKLRVLRMGVNMPQLTECKTKTPPTPVVFCPANLVEVKGHRYLIEAWRILRNRGVSGELWLAGQGELEQQLRTLIRDLNLQGSIRLLGALPHAALLQLYETNSVSAVVLASIDAGNDCHEGIPVALVEAMSYGIPVISTETGAIPELILPGTGVLVPPKAPHALATAIQQLLETRKTAEEIGWRGRLRVVQTHDIRTIAAALQDSFEAARLQARPS
jgi:colanic acid/amylovoran biosynthesis glycosyltransferase